MKNVILGITLGIFLMTSCSSSTPNEADAKEAARAVVLQNVKNPVDLKFHQNDEVKNLGDNAFEYKETINATNSYGGSIEQNVTVTVKWIKDDPSEVKNWSIIDIKFSDR